MPFLKYLVSTTLALGLGGLAQAETVRIALGTQDTALGEIGGEAALQLLRVAENDPDPDVRKIARLAVARLHGTA